MKRSIKNLQVLLILLLCVSTTIQAQKKKKSIDQDWFHQDLKKKGNFGVSSQKAYDELLKGKKSQPIIVAVIDGGTDVNHKDLKAVVWVNSKEIPGNGIDDDKNGYIDDINGWNFIGGKDSNVNEDTYEATRIYNKYKSLYDNADPSSIPDNKRDEYQMYKDAKDFHLAKRNTYQQQIDNFSKVLELFKKIESKSNGQVITKEFAESYKGASPQEENIVKRLAKLKISATYLVNIYDGVVSGAQHSLNYSLNPEFNPRTIVGDNYDDINEKSYGNNQVIGPKAEHGTHVAGIIAAERNNGYGMDGIADNAKIMVLRVVPDGDERDKDIANAIYYAVNNGAKIINMSFGKDFSPGKYKVDEAVKYAVSKGVLLVHAAGNDNENIDEGNNFPKDAFINSIDTASSWIEVGASSNKKNKTLPADFSNYGRINVDLFAPGVSIYSTMPDNKFEFLQGTSMAAPVVAGVAAMLWSYFPELTALQVKEILMQSTIPVKNKVLVPGTTKMKVSMKDLCQTGGVINAYQAVKLAMKKYPTK